MWWLVYNWLDVALDYGYERSEWFHGDCMLLVDVYPRPHYVVGILPVPMEKQTPRFN